MKTTINYILYLSVAVAIAVVGCAFEDQTLVSIEDESFTVADFKDRYQFAPTEDSVQRVEKIREFIDQMLMVHEGRTKGYDTDPVVQSAFEAHQKEVVYRAYYEAEVVDQVKVSESEIREMYNKIIDKYHLAQIVVDNDSVAQYVQGELDKGVPFESLLVVSLDTMTENGDIGEFSVISLPPEILTALEKTQEGKTTNMINFGNYYYFLKIISHTKSDDPKFEDVRELISNNIKREKIGEEHDKFIGTILQEAKVEYNDEGLNALTKPDSVITEEELNMWVVKKYDTSYVFVKTIREAVMHQYRQSFIPPEKLIERVLIPDLMYDKAMREHFDRRPHVKRRLKSALSTLVYQKVYNEMVHEMVSTDSLEVVDYYEKHKDTYGEKSLSEVYSVAKAHLRSARVDSLKRMVGDQLREKYRPDVNEKVLVKLLREKEER